MPSHDCQDITKGRSLFVVPGSLLERKLSIWIERLPKKGHKTVETKEKRCRAPGGQVRPLALGFQAYMSAPFPRSVVSRLQRAHKIKDNLLSSLCLICG